LTDDLLQFLREWDRPRYLSLLLMPGNKREDILALYAFNAELERVPLMVSEPQIGEIRLQWWIDTLDAMEKGTEQDHPVAKALMICAAKHHLPYPALRNMAEARTRLLYADRPEDIEELEAYCGNTSSALIQLSAMVLGGNEAKLVSEAAGLAGVAQGLADIIAEQKRFANLVPKNWTIDGLAKQADSRLQEARAYTLPLGSLLAFLPCALVQSQIRKGNQRLSPLRTQWILWWASRKKRF
jgi:15-cis-phytoene synthase